jgi:transcriptional regulator with GAF, ATPase, and Fis domain
VVDADKLTDAMTRIAAHDDLAGFLAAVAQTSQEVLEADAVGVMVRSDIGRLQLLVASSHRSAELELFQSQIAEGPCVDAADEAGSVALVGADALVAKWPRFGPSMVEAGFLAVHSAPLRWRDGAVGAMALFRKEAKSFDVSDDEAAQRFADVVARRVMGDDEADGSSSDDRIRTALSSRISIERAKGLIAELEGVEMDEAYRLLLERSRSRGESLTLAAERLVSADWSHGRSDVT